MLISKIFIKPHFLLLLATSLLFGSVRCQQKTNKDNSVSSLENDFIIDWNHLTYQIAFEHDQFYSLKGIRSLSMVHLAMHDALNVISPKFETYAYHDQNKTADPITAASFAAYNILCDAYPNRKDTISLLHNLYLNQIKEGDRKARGKLLGEAIAFKYITLRNGDGHEKQGDYTPMSKPGDYQYTPGWDNWVLKPDFSVAMPFALDTVSQFRSPEPPSLESKKYAKDYNEIKAFGYKKSAVRTADQTNFAHWWAEFAEHSWNRIGRKVANEKSLSAFETARMFALINMDIYDIYLASLESKYYYDTWRPYSAIRKADQDSNPATTPQKDWKPEMLTPPWPEYPSAHAAVGAGGAEMISHVLGTSSWSFEMVSTSALPDAKTRSFNDLFEAAKECAESRIMNGYHFRFATDEGLDQGIKIARFIHSNYLRPL